MRTSEEEKKKKQKKKKKGLTQLPPIQCRAWKSKGGKNVGREGGAARLGRVCVSTRFPQRIERHDIRWTLWALWPVLFPTLWDGLG